MVNREWKTGDIFYDVMLGEARKTTRKSSELTGAWEAKLLEKSFPKQKFSDFDDGIQDSRVPI